MPDEARVTAESARPCEVHVTGRDQPSPWCAACRMAAAPGRPTCWRSECRNGCYYPSVCSEVSTHTTPGMRSGGDQ